MVLFLQFVSGQAMRCQPCIKILQLFINNPRLPWLILFKLFTNWATRYYQLLFVDGGNFYPHQTEPTLVASPVINSGRNIVISG